MNTSMPSKKSKQDKLIKLINELNQNNYSMLAQLNDHRFYSSHLRGIAPIINQLQEDSFYFKDAIIVDKVVGKAVAMLLIKAKVKYIYALTISKKAIAILDKFKIEYDYDTACDFIENRTHTGMCPMEQSVDEINDIEEAYLILINKVRELSGGSK